MVEQHFSERVGLQNDQLHDLLERVFLKTSTLLGKSLAKFFKRDGAIIEKYDITLREIRLTIQD